jgi:hypothetical protein
MNLPDYYSKGPLNDLRVKMSATLVTDISLSAKQFDALTIEELEELTRVGLDRFLSDCKVEDDLTLTYKGKRVVVYIHDRHQYSEDWDLPRFHVASCPTLHSQSAKDAYNQKYVIFQPREDGLFPMRVFVNGIMDQSFKKLDICRQCLDTLHWKNFSIKRLDERAKKEIVSNFNFTDFFEKYPKDALSTLPKHTPETIPINEYPTDWWQIRKRLFDKRGYRCEGENCGDTIGPLEVHHKNGIRSNNDDYNLEILCHRCHQKHHSHYI